MGILVVLKSKQVRHELNYSATDLYPHLILGDSPSNSRAVWKASQGSTVYSKYPLRSGANFLELGLHGRVVFGQTLDRNILCLVVGKAKVVLRTQ